MIVSRFKNESNRITVLNTRYPKTGQYKENWHGTIISAAGPVVTLNQAFIFYFLLRRGTGKLLFSFMRIRLMSY